MWLFARLTRTYEAPEGGGMSLAQVAILFRLTRRGPARLSDLAGDMRLELSVASRQVSDLIDGGLVRRGKDPHDRRAVRLSITKPGQRVVAAMSHKRDAWIGQALSTWSERDILEAAHMVEAVSRVVHDPAILAEVGAIGANHAGTS